MASSALQLRNIAFLGAGKSPASLAFRTGLNVICGASDTGKSFIAETIDFLLGGSDPLRDIPERVGYDRARIGIETRQDKQFTLERSVQGGSLLRYDGLLGVEEPAGQSVSLKDKHARGRTDTLSGWLLSQLGFVDPLIRSNSSGSTRSLSFRDLARLIIVQETEITKQGSPFLSIQVVNRTSEYSALKLLLTGVDDSALVPGTNSLRERENASAKIELIDQWLSELLGEVRELGVDQGEIESQLKNLEDMIARYGSELQRIQQRLDESLTNRREILKEREDITGRVEEIQDLLSRFDLLGTHYGIDIERLTAMQETGSLFVHVANAPCPLCGALPEAQHLSSDCEGDIEGTVQAASAEIEKIRQLSSELNQTVVDLHAESNDLSVRLRQTEELFRAVDDEIRGTISPELKSARDTFAEVIEKRSEVRRTVDLFHRIDGLQRQKSELSEDTGGLTSGDSSRTDLSKTVLDELAEQVRTLLQAWNFPGADRVYFDEGTKDFVIDGKPRGSRGKGLRAITYAAASIGLMEYCQAKSLPHPGFLVLDSPLLAYWAPEGEEDKLLQGTDLKDRFYKYLASRHVDSQIVIIENEHPPEVLRDQMSFTIFTKNPGHGTYGFFPVD